MPWASALVVLEQVPEGLHASLHKMILLVAQLQENGLLAFSWDLGRCIPSHLFGREGYLTRNRLQVQSLSLITPTLG